MKKRNASTAGAALVMIAAVMFLCAGCGNHEAVMEERQTRAQGTDIRYLLFQGVPGPENTDERSTWIGACIRQRH